MKDAQRLYTEIYKTMREMKVVLNEKLLIFVD